MIHGYHHITAISNSAEDNVAFYTKILGLRLVKKTVNFDDPTSYHLYYGDYAGSPGTLLTFFIWSHSSKGTVGTEQAITLCFSIPEGSLKFWQTRLKTLGIEFRLVERFGNPHLSFNDPDGLNVELVESPTSPQAIFQKGPVPVKHAITGLYTAVLWYKNEAKTVALLNFLGFTPVAQENNKTRYKISESEQYIDLIKVPGFGKATLGAGSIHHLAFRVANDDEQDIVRKEILAAHYHITPRIDRHYFHSLYFREPGDILFEIATDTPGFTIDEPLESLGTTLQLPPNITHLREYIESALPNLP